MRVQGTSLKTLSRDLASAKSMAGLLGLDLALQLPTLAVHPNAHMHPLAMASRQSTSLSMGPSCRRHVAAGLCGVIGEPYKAGGVRPATAKPALTLLQSLFDATFPSSRCRRQAEAYPARSHSAGFYKHRPRLCMGHFLWTSEFSKSCQGLPELAAGAGPQLSREGATSQHTLLRVWDCLALSDVPIRGALGFRGSGMRLPTSAEAEGPEASQLEPEKEPEKNGPRKARRVDATDAAVKRHAFVTIMGISPSKGARRAHHSVARDQSCGSRVPV